MDAIFLRVLNMNITACYVILAVILIRLLLRKAPRIFSYTLWAAVLFRLVFPFSFESVFSLVRIRTQPVPESIISAANPQIQSGIAVVDQVVNRSLPAPVSPEASISPIQIWIFFGELLWLAGVVLLVGYSIFSFLRLYRKLKSASHIEDNLYEIAAGGTPFVFGIRSPKIYLPAGLSGSEREYILRHEQTHIKRFGHVIKPLAFLVLCVHWFNPLVWVAFFLMSADMEMSCDESVIKQMGGGIKKEYSSSLLSLSAGKTMVGGCPLAFGEGNLKGRIKNILSYKRPAFWVILLAVAVVAAACVGLISDPKGNGLPGGDSQGESVPEGLTVEEYGERFVREQLSVYENAEQAGFKIIDSEITSFERLDRFEGMLDYPVEIWRLEYRWKPDDIEKAMRFLGDVREADGWITYERNGWIAGDKNMGIPGGSNMGLPLLVFSYETPEPRYLGDISTNDAVWGDPDRVSGRETLLRVFLEQRGALPHETYKGDHVLVKFLLSTGETCHLFLSQPVTKGPSGIWCVERWMDGNGAVYYDTPDTEGAVLDFYRQIQAECDSGQTLWRLDPLVVSLDYTNNVLGQHVYQEGLEAKYNAGIADFEETPESSYLGYFLSPPEAYKPGHFSFNFDRVEWLTLDDTERLRQLGVDPNDLNNGFYIHNPNTYPDHFQGTDETRFRILEAAGDKEMGHKEVSAEEFRKYLAGFDDPKSNEGFNSKSSNEGFGDPIAPGLLPLFRIVTKDGFVQSVEEQYVP